MESTDKTKTNPLCLYLSSETVMAHCKRGDTLLTLDEVFYVAPFVSYFQLVDDFTPAGIQEAVNRWPEGFDPKYVTCYGLDGKPFRIENRKLYDPRIAQKFIHFERISFEQTKRSLLPRRFSSIFHGFNPKVFMEKLTRFGGLKK